MSGVLERTLGVLEVLTSAAGRPAAAHDRGTSSNIPASAAHRLLSELVKHAAMSARLRDQGDYGLTTKLVAMVLDYMGATGIVDFAQPILDRLAQTAGEFIRLAVVDGRTADLGRACARRAARLALRSRRRGTRAAVLHGSRAMPG